MKRQKGFFTIDVEDYHHIIGVSVTPGISQWDGMIPRVEVGLNRRFELMEWYQVRGTLFFLGYLARRFPETGRRALALGHEMASHGMYHQSVPGMTAERFFERGTGRAAAIGRYCWDGSAGLAQCRIFGGRAKSVVF